MSLLVLIGCASSRPLGSLELEEEGSAGAGDGAGAGALDGLEAGPRDSDAAGGAGGQLPAGGAQTSGGAPASTGNGAGDGAAPSTERACESVGDLPQIAHNEGPFTLCESAEECPWPDGHICYGPVGRQGICLQFDADDTCDGDEVHLLTDPHGDRDVGICVPPAWKRYICCEGILGFRCDATAAAEPGPEPEPMLPLEQVDCIVESLVVTPTTLSPTDGCRAELACDGATLVVECDGENDGTNTSLCGCGVDAPPRFVGLFDGEGREACLNAAHGCGVREAL